VKLELLRKYFDNKCSQKEVKQVQQWIERSEASMDLEGEFNTAWQTINVKSGDYSKWSSKLEKIHERIEMEELYVSLNLKNKKNEAGYRAKDRLPIAGHERRKSSARKIQYFAQGFLITMILIVLVIAYFKFPEKSEQAPPLVYIEKVTEPGQKLTFHLEDGTEVVLNAASKLVYPLHFGDSDRKLELIGEAFFKVKKDVTRPFQVLTGSISTTAIGTSFNINNFPANEKIEIALVSGQVSVEKFMQSGESSLLILNPGEMVKVLKSDNSITKSFFDFDQNISWKNGLIFFKDADYHEVVSKLERWYGVSIHADKNPINEWRFSGKFEEETLENILIALQFGHDFEYIIEGKEVKLNF